MHIAALGAGEPGSGGKESALVKIHLTQTERKQYKSTGSLTHVAAVGKGRFLTREFYITAHLSRCMCRASDVCCRELFNPLKVEEEM